MQVRTGAVSSASHIADYLSLGDLVTDFDRQLAVMGIKGFITVAMVDLYHIAISAAPAGCCNSSAVRCFDGGTHGICVVNSGMVTAAAAAEGRGYISADRTHKGTGGRIGWLWFGPDFDDGVNRFCQHLLGENFPVGFA